MAELLALADDETRAAWDGLRLGYTESTGHPLLRAEIAALYEELEPDDVLVFAGAEEAIFCLLNVLLGPGDHAIVTWPGYQSLYEVGRAAGAEVTLHELREADGWALDVERLVAAIRPTTRARRRQRPAQPDGDAADPRRVAAARATRCRAAGHPPARRRGLPLPRARRGDRPCRRAPSSTRAASRSASCRSRSRWPACGSAGWRRATATCSTAAPRSRTTRRSARRRRRRSWRSSACGPARASSPARGRSSATTWPSSTLFRRRATAFRRGSGRAAARSASRASAPASPPTLRRRARRGRGRPAPAGLAFGHPGNHFRIGFGREDLPAALERLDAFLEARAIA